MLLYPRVGICLSETVELQGHEIRWESIDLAAGWEDIEERLLQVIKSEPRADATHARVIS